MGDAGVTGRKIIVDSYGGMARHGGGAFSGKDPTKVDRSGAYAARWVAKNVVAAGLADRFELEVAYAIGIAHPLSLSIETYGTGKVPDEQILALIKRHFDLRPASIISRAGPAPPDLPADRRVRPLRPARPRPALGAHGQGGAARLRGRPPHARGRPRRVAPLSRARRTASRRSRLTPPDAIAWACLQGARRYRRAHLACGRDVSCQTSAGVARGGPGSTFLPAVAQHALLALRRSRLSTSSLELRRGFASCYGR